LRKVSKLISFSAESLNFPLVKMIDENGKNFSLLATIS